MALFHYYTKIAAIGGLSLLMLLPGALAGVERIQPGDARDVVIQELGSSFAPMKFGSFETLVYTDGTSVSLKNGVVTEVRPGKQIITDFRTSASARRLATTAPQNNRPQDRVEPTKGVQKEDITPPPLDPKPGVPKTTTDSTPVKAPGSVDKPASRPQPAVAHAPGATTPRLSTNLAALSISRKSKQLPAVMAFSGGSGKTFNPAGGLVWFGRLAKGAAVLFLGLLIGLYAFVCHCLERICRKAGQQPGVLIWIPVAQSIPLLRVAQMPLWTLVLLFVPIANLVLLFTVWAKICSALGKSPWLVVLLLIPIANLGLIVYLAFGEASVQAAQGKDPDPSSDKAPKPEVVALESVGPAVSS